MDNNSQMLTNTSEQIPEPKDENSDQPDLFDDGIIGDSVEVDITSNSEVSYIQGYNQLNSTLDEISNYLDVLEKKNDDLREELQKLLEENKQIQSELKQEEQNL